MAHIEIDDYYLEEQDEPTVRERLGLDDTGRRHPLTSRQGAPQEAPGRLIVHPAVVVRLARRRDERIPLVA